MARRVVVPTFVQRELKVGAGWYVVATWPNGRTQHIGGFVNELDASEWIKNESAAWVAEHASGRK